MDPFVEIFGHPAQWRPLGTVRIGRVTLPPQAVADILIEAREEGATNRRAGEVTLHIADTSELPVWSNQDAIAIDVDGQQQFIGVIERVYAVGPAELRIRFVDRIRLLELGKLGIVHGNVPKGQVLAFIWRLGLYSGWPDLQLHGFDENPARRPFLFAVPFPGMAAQRAENHGRGLGDRVLFGAPGRSATNTDCL